MKWYYLFLIYIIVVVEIATMYCIFFSNCYYHLQ
jgi:hypothetical protein